MRNKILIPAAILIGACAVNPVTGRRQFMTVSESQEVSMGQQLLQQTQVEIGFYPDTGLQQLVSRMGLQMAAASERPQLPWEFHLIDDPMVNAFAAPGGFIFITRGILAHLNSEAELAGVVGHEIGHVTARHSAAQMSTQQLLTVGLVAGSIAAPDAMGGALGQGLQAAAGLTLLKFGRDDESQSDGLGHRYSLHQGYDVREMPKTFVTLKRASDAAGSGGRMPAFMSTHPDPGDRVAATQAWADTVSDYSSLRTNRDQFLNALDGMVFGNDPRQGYVENNRFLHPTLLFQLPVPNGWKTLNQAHRFVMGEPEGRAQVELSGVQEATPRAAADAFAGQEGVTVTGRDDRALNGLQSSAVQFRAQTSQGSVIVGVARFTLLGGTVYQVLGLMTSQNATQLFFNVQSVVRSFGPISGNQSFRRVRELDVITLTAQTTLDALADRSGGAATVAELALINGLDEGTVLPRGRKLKTVRFR